MKEKEFDKNTGLFWWLTRRLELC